MRSNKLADFVLRVAWVAAYALLIRTFILLKKVEGRRVAASASKAKM